MVRQRVKCFSCGAMGHVAAQCSTDRKRVCYKCRERGHIGKNCPLNHCEEQQGLQQQQQPSQIVQVRRQQAQGYMSTEVPSDAEASCDDEATTDEEATTNAGEGTTVVPSDTDDEATTDEEATTDAVEGVKCFSCGALGHVAAQCSTNRKCVCYKCRERGHIVKNCPLNHREEQQGLQQQQQPSQIVQVRRQQAQGCMSTEVPSDAEASCDDEATTDEEATTNAGEGTMVVPSDTETTTDDEATTDEEATANAVEGVNCFSCGALGHVAAQCSTKCLIMCYKCREPGHIAKDCPHKRREKQQGLQQQQQPSQIIMCYKCREPGHIAKDCPHKRREKQQGLQQQQQPSQIIQVQLQQAQGSMSMVVPSDAEATSDEATTDEEATTDAVKGRPGHKCFSCGGRGHIAARCPTGQPVCFKCGEAGYIAKECTRPYCEQQQGLQKQQQQRQIVQVPQQQMQGDVYTVVPSDDRATIDVVEECILSTGRRPDPAAVSSSFAGHLSSDGFAVGAHHLWTANDLRGSSSDYLLSDTLLLHSGAYGRNDFMDLGSQATHGLRGLTAGTRLGGGVSSSPLVDPPMVSQKGDAAQSVKPGISDLLTDRNTFSLRKAENLSTDESNTLFVEGLPKDCTRREVAHLFRPFVGFKEIRVIFKGPRYSGEKALVICFVEFSDAKCALVARDALQGYIFDNKDPNALALRIQFVHFPSQPPSCR